MNETILSLSSARWSGFFVWFEILGFPLCFFFVCLLECVKSFYVCVPDRSIEKKFIIVSASSSFA